MGWLNLANLIRKDFWKEVSPLGLHHWYVQGVHSCVCEIFLFVFTYIPMPHLFLHVQGILFLKAELIQLLEYGPELWTVKRPLWKHLYR